MKLRTTLNWLALFGFIAFGLAVFGTAVLAAFFLLGWAAGLAAFAGCAAAVTWALDRMFEEDKPVDEHCAPESVVPFGRPG